jgi:hypothetical protein
MRIVALASIVIVASLAANAAEPLAPLRVGLFQVDASPPVGSPLAYDPAKAVETPLSCRGLVLLGDGKPIVMCAVDWIGIGNGAHDFFRERLAAAADTTADRVAVHALHQHDAPWCDFEMDGILSAHGLSGQQFDSGWARATIERTAAAVRKAVAEPVAVTHIGLGRAQVKEVASNRRILGPDGKVKSVRYSATKDPAIRAEPEGVIDPELKLIALFEGDKPQAVLTFYATHPQSYYRTGRANPDFPGLARNHRQQVTSVPHLHFNGAGGNITAGKYNDGSPANRAVLADRLEAGMKSAWDTVRKSAVSRDDVGWSSVAVALPLAQHLDEASLLATVRDNALPMGRRSLAAGGLVFLHRSRAGAKANLGCLRLGSARVLSMPGELFVEYQLAAQQMRPDFFVAMAAYGDYGPSYIGTAIAYEQGGYETQPTSSLVAPQVEGVLLDGLRTLLNAPGRGPHRLGVDSH